MTTKPPTPPSVASHTPGSWMTKRGRANWAIYAGAYAVAVGVDHGADANLIAAAPALLETLRQAVDESGYRLSGPTDHRAAEDGEPPWVCNARAAFALAKGKA